MLMICNDSLVEQVGFEAGVFLQRVKYWLERCGKHLAGEDGLWIFNCLEDWHKQFKHWSLSKLRRVIKSLEDKKIILSKKPNAKKWDHTKWYRINFEGSSVDLKNSLLGESDSFSSGNNTPPEKLTVGSRGERAKKDREEKTEDKEQETVKMLLKIWENEIPYQNEWEKLTEDRHRVLLGVFAEYFKSDMQEWKRFVLYITASPFLMGKRDFRITLSWAIRKKNLGKILSGKYHRARMSEKKEAVEVLTTSLEHSLVSLEERKDINSDWHKVLIQAKNRWGVSTYISWLSQVKFESFKDGILSLEVPSIFIKNCIESNFGKGLFDISVKYFEGLKRLRVNSSAGNEDRQQQLEKYMSHIRKSKSLEKIFGDSIRV